MKGMLTALAVCLSLVLGSGTESLGKVEMGPQKTVPLSRTPLDIAASADGKRIFVLQEGGGVQIYSVSGELEDELQVDAGSDRIAVSPQGNLMFWSNGGEKSLTLATLDYVREISTAGSPYKGPADAPVEVAVFSDFQ